MNDRCDIAIVGAGAMGSATAFFLSRRREAGSVLLIEKDASYAKAASALSTGGFRQQFSTAINVRTARVATDFILDAERWLSLPDQPADLGVREAGYLFLGSESQVPGFVRNHRTQRALGADVALLDRAQLASRFPWLGLRDVAIGSFGMSGEGWFDGYSLAAALRRNARRQGTRYRLGDVSHVERTADGTFLIQLTDGGTVTAQTLVNTAGTGAPALSALLGLHTPVRLVKQTVFVFSSPERIDGMPYVFTPSGLFCRPEGGDYIAGLGVHADAPTVAIDDFEVDHAQFEASVWPRLAEAIPGFERLRLRSGWAGHYDLSTFDHNPFIGAVDAVPGYYIATGFSGHGIMQSPAVGLALSELILDGAYRTLDLSELGYGRISGKAPVHETIQY